MKLRVEDITAEEKHLDFAEPQAELNRLLDRGPLHDYRVNTPVAVAVSYYRSGMELFFSGELTAVTTAVCARCAEEFDTSTTRGFRFVLAPKAAGDTGQADLRSEDLEFSLYEGEEVDLSPLVREQALLALSARPLCNEECRGLCPSCGVNLNNESCGCQLAPADPRLAMLRSLKISRR